MPVCSQLATQLDEEMPGPAVISPAHTPISALPLKTGLDVSKELGGRYLLRYLLPHQVTLFSAGATALQYATPTPYSSTETLHWLALPGTLPRDYVLLLDPSLIPWIRGPRRVRLAYGIEYILPGGFPRSAIVPPGIPILVA
jgi:hypothetical protein